jgi:hypothetical protein
VVLCHEAPPVVRRSKTSPCYGASHVHPSRQTALLRRFVRFKEGALPDHAAASMRSPALVSPYIRKTPKESLPRTALLKAALSAMPRTVRVSRGSITPSSHTRAVA